MNMNRIIVPDTWTVEEALTVTAFLEHLLQTVYDLHGARIDKARQRHQWLGGDGSYAARENRNKMPP